MTDDDMTAHRLADEIERLQRTEGPFTFVVGPFDSYMLVATLQLSSRHPHLSDVQRDIVVRIARGIALTLREAARSAFGPDSAIELTLKNGFDPAQDVPVDDAPSPDATTEAQWTETVSSDERYVRPTWDRRPDDDGADELCKCALCGKFFVSGVPVRLFTSSEPVLGFEVCDACVPTVVGGEIIRGG